MNEISRRLERILLSFGTYIVPERVQKKPAKFYVQHLIYPSV